MPYLIGVECPIDLRIVYFKFMYIMYIYIANNQLSFLACDFIYFGRYFAIISCHIFQTIVLSISTEDLSNNFYTESNHQSRPQSHMHTENFFLLRKVNESVKRNYTFKNDRFPDVSNTFQELLATKEAKTLLL